MHITDTIKEVNKVPWNIKINLAFTQKAAQSLIISVFGILPISVCLNSVFFSNLVITVTLYPLPPPCRVFVWLMSCLSGFCRIKMYSVFLPVMPTRWRIPNLHRYFKSLKAVLSVVSDTFWYSLLVILPFFLH